MTIIIQLAADAFDRMSNPIYGSNVNEDAAMRFGALLDDDTEGALLGEIRELSEPLPLSSSSWVWLLGWATSRNTRFSDSLLTTLCTQSTSATFTAQVIRHGLTVNRDRSDDLATRQAWLGALVNSALDRAAASNDEPASPVRDDELAGSTGLEALLFALLTVGDENELALTSAADLLRSNGAAARGIRGSFREWIRSLERAEALAWQRFIRERDLSQSDLDLDL